MKKIISILIIACITNSSLHAQGFVGGNIDSIKPLILKVEEFSATKITMRQRTDSMENYLFYDDTRFIRVKANMKTKKSFEGLNVKTVDEVSYIVVSGPPEIIKKIFTQYLKSCSGLIASGVDVIKTNNWDAVLKDEKIENKERVEMEGLAIWITKHRD